MTAASRIAAKLSARAAEQRATAPAPGRSRELCIMACVFCKDPLFWRWIESLDMAPIIWTVDEAGAKAFITTTCAVNSRTALDTDPVAAERFHRLVRLPFLVWKEAANG